MIDIHSHILPGVDDGAINDKEAIKMAQEAVYVGIKTIVATPHHKNKNYQNEKAKIVNEVNRLNKVFEKSLIPIKLLPGQEVRAHDRLIKEINQGKIQTLNDTKYLLLELPSDHVPSSTEQLIFDIQQIGIVPIIAHPERNKELHQNPNKLYTLVTQGALAQATAGSITGMFGRKVKITANQMLEHHLIHFVGSDAHNLEPQNFKVLKNGYEIIRRKHGVNMQKNLKESAQNLINNENINQNEPLRIKKKKRFFLF